MAIYLSCVVHSLSSLGTAGAAELPLWRSHISTIVAGAHNCDAAIEAEESAGTDAGEGDVGDGERVVYGKMTARSASQSEKGPDV